MKTSKYLYQWDINQHFIDVVGVYVDYTINDEVYRVEVHDKKCVIPDELLQIPGSHVAYECFADGTKTEVRFNVAARPIPPDYIFTPTEKITFDTLVQKVEDAIDTIPGEVADYVEEHKEELKGDPGKQGDPGIPGHTPIKGVDYFTSEDIESLGIDSKMMKFLLTYDGTNIKYGDDVLTYADIYSMLMNTPDFVVLVYNDRVFHPNRVTAEQIVFISSYVSNAQETMERISIMKTDVVTMTSGTSEAVVNKVDVITDVNKDSLSKYPSNKAVVDYVASHTYDDTELRSEISQLSESITEKVGDVQINGASIVQDGVAEIPIADKGVYGLVLYGSGSNTGLRKGASNDAIMIDRAVNSEILLRNNLYKPIVPGTLVYAVDSVLTSTADSEQLTDEQQVAARTRLGLEKEWELKGTLIDSEIQVDLTGCTELIIKGFVNTSAAVNFKANKDTLVPNMTSSSSLYRRFYFYIQEIMGTILGSVGRYTTISSTDILTASINTHTLLKSLSDIKSFSFSSWEVVTECNLEIWAR